MWPGCLTVIVDETELCSGQQTAVNWRSRSYKVMGHGRWILQVATKTKPAATSMPSWAVYEMHAPCTGQCPSDVHN